MMMACALAVAQPAASLAPPSGKRTLSGGRPPRLPPPRLSGKLAFATPCCVRGAGKLIRSRAVVAKAAQDDSESSGSIVKYVASSVSFLLKKASNLKLLQKGQIFLALCDSPKAVSILY